MRLCALDRPEPNLLYLSPSFLSSISFINCLFCSRYFPHHSEETFELKSNRYCTAISGVRQVFKGMLICALFGMREFNMSDFQTSELHALNIVYFHYVHGEASSSSFNLVCSFGPITLMHLRQPARLTYFSGIMFAARGRLFIPFFCRQCGVGGCRAVKRPTVKLGYVGVC